MRQNDTCDYSRGMTLRKWTFTVDDEDADLRLDQLIAKRTDLSRRAAREALKLGGSPALRDFLHNRYCLDSYWSIPRETS